MNVIGPVIMASVGAEEPGADEGFEAPEAYLNRHGQLTNGTYTLNEPDMAPHMPMTAVAGSGKSVFLSTVNADQAVLDAAAFADANNLWTGANNATAKVYVLNGPIGVLGRTGELTNWINLYRTDTLFLHGSPGNAP